AWPQRLPGGAKSAGIQGSGNDPSSTMRDTGSTRRASGLLEPPVERGWVTKPTGAVPWAGEKLVLHKPRFHPDFVAPFSPLAKGLGVTIFPPLQRGGNTVRPQSCSMLIIHEKPDSLLEGRCFQSRSRCRNARPASIGL